jgi:hypothetical protein
MNRTNCFTNWRYNRTKYDSGMTIKAFLMNEGKFVHPVHLAGLLKEKPWERLSSRAKSRIKVVKSCVWRGLFPETLKF